MRWWLNTDHGAFAVENAAVKGIDCSALDPSIWMVQWTDGKGEIERQTPEGENENGLRERFIDVVPYAPFFQQFLTRLPGVTLPQAKKVQIDLIGEIFESKRQAPFHYPVAAGDFWWDASDVGPMAANTSTAISDLVAAVNALTTRVNNLADSLNYVASSLNSVPYYLNNTLVAQINSFVVDAGNLVSYYVNTNVVASANNIRYYANYQVNVLEGYLTSVIPTISGAILQYNVPVGEGTAPVAAPGLGSALGAPAATTNPHSCSDIPTLFTHVGGIGWSNIQAVATNHPPVVLSSVQWIPIGRTTPVNLTAAESKGLMDGINNRTKALQGVKTSKTAAVNALTTVPAVIAYDVTTGWPT